MPRQCARLDTTAVAEAALQESIEQLTISGLHRQERCPVTGNRLTGDLLDRCFCSAAPVPEGSSARRSDRFMIPTVHTDFVPLAADSFQQIRQGLCQNADTEKSGRRFVVGKELQDLVGVTDDLLAIRTRQRTEILNIHRESVQEV